ncbi:MAG TPA: hypothetical protein PLU35_12235 [Phycisphaerales bacterium]|nr:hypothetical protein [Phycisphaerales bacterium]
MARYYVNRNAQANGDHEVHKEGCAWMPEPHNRDPLGEHSSCHTAVYQAKLKYPTADGCKHRSPECHTR